MKKESTKLVIRQRESKVEGNKKIPWKGLNIYGEITHDRSMVAPGFKKSHLPVI